MVNPKGTAISSGRPEAQKTAALQLDTVYERYAPYVAAIGMKMIGRHHEVDDLVQDVFLEVHKGLSRLEDPAAIKGWLGTITVRVARRRLRRNKVRAFFRLDDVGGYEECAAPDASPEERAHVASVYRILDELPVNERLMWLLRHVEGETLKRTADMMGCSLSTVQRGLRRAQATIDERLESLA